MKFLSAIILLQFTFSLTAQNLWQDKEHIPIDGRHHPITFAINDTGYLLTGSTLDDYNRDFYSYDPNTDTWTQKEDFPGGERSFAYGVAYKGKAYIGMGRTANERLDDLWMYDPETDTWTQLADCDCPPRIHPAFVAANDAIYVGLGGVSGGNANDFWKYDIATDTWTQMEDFPGERRHHPYYFALEDDVFVGFGHGADIYNDFYRFDTDTETWSQVASLPDQGRVAGTQFSYNGKGYVLSGQGETHGNLPTGEFWEYDPILDVWIQLPPHPGTGRWAPGSFIINDELYFMCGESDIYENTLMSLDLRTDTKVVEISTESLNIFPNPSAQASWTIEVDNPIKSASLMAISGKKMFTLQVSNHMIYSNEEVGQGTYLLMATDGTIEYRNVVIITQN